MRCRREKTPDALTLCAWLRFLRGIDSDWRLRIKSYAELMRFNNYPTTPRCAGLPARPAWTSPSSRWTNSCFAAAAAPPARCGGCASSKLERLAARTAGLVLFQRYMILKDRS
jgi:hypothetical protein